MNNIKISSYCYTNHNMPRSNNKFRFRYHVTGTLNEQVVDKKYCSYTGFLNDYGGDATPLNIDRHKLSRILKQSTTANNKCNQLVNSMWKLDFKRIDEQRPYIRVFRKELVDETIPKAFDTVNNISNAPIIPA